LPLYKRHRIIEPVLNGVLGLHNKPKAEMHLGHKLTGPKEVEVQVEVEHISLELDSTDHGKPQKTHTRLLVYTPPFEHRISQT
jgi:hypothetical protein